MVLYLTRYNIKGSVATLRAMPTPFYLSMINFCVFWALMHVYMGLIITSPPKISFQNTLYNRRIGGRAFVSSREVVLY